MTLRVPWLPFGIDGLTITGSLMVLHKDAGTCVEAHERVHQAEWTPMWLFRYLTSSAFRVEAEARAYRAEAACLGWSPLEFAGTLRNGYWLREKDKDRVRGLLA